MPGLADQDVPSGLPVPQVRQLPDPEHSSEQSWRDVCRNSVFMLKACHWCIGGIAISSLDTQHPEKNKKVEKMCKIKWIRTLTHYIFQLLLPSANIWNDYWQELSSSNFTPPRYSFFFIKQITYQIKNGKLWKGENVNWKPDLNVSSHQTLVIHPLTTQISKCCI